jgi:hypothetical protein
MKTYAPLIGRIRQQLIDLESSVKRAKTLMKKALSTGDDGYWDGVALNLHSFYTGAENIFKDIAKTIDGELPQGSDWHKKLLLQMACEIPETRKSVIGSETRHCLEEYRAFRHIVRSVYTFKLDFERIKRFCDELESCYKALCSDLEKFNNFCLNLTDTTNRI